MMLKRTSWKGLDSMGAVPYPQKWENQGFLELKMDPYLIAGFVILFAGIVLATTTVFKFGVPVGLQFVAIGLILIVFRLYRRK